MLVECNRTVGNLLLLVDRQQLCLRQMLEDVAHAEDYDGVTDNEHALAAIFAGKHLSRAAEAKNDIAPTLPSRRPVIELAEESAELGLIRELILDAGRGEPVEYSELLLPEPLVDDQRKRILPHARCFHDQTGSMTGAEIRRGEHNAGLFFAWQITEPASKRDRLALAELRERNIHIPD